jgi:hypothetical protein
MRVCGTPQTANSTPSYAEPVEHLDMERTMRKHETAAERIWKEHVDSCLSLREAVVLLLGIVVLLAAL